MYMDYPCFLMNSLQMNDVFYAARWTFARMHGDIRLQEMKKDNGIGATKDSKKGSSIKKKT